MHLKGFSSAMKMFQPEAAPVLVNQSLSAGFEPSYIKKYKKWIPMLFLVFDQNYKFI